MRDILEALQREPKKVNVAVMYDKEGKGIWKEAPESLEGFDLADPQRLKFSDGKELKLPGRSRITHIAKNMGVDTVLGVVVDNKTLYIPRKRMYAYEIWEGVKK